MSRIKHDLNIPVSLRAPALNTGYLSASHTKGQQKSQLFENYASTDLLHSSTTVNVQLRSSVGKLLKEQNFFAIFSAVINFMDRSFNPKCEHYFSFQPAN